MPSRVIDWRLRPTRLAGQTNIGDLVQGPAEVVDAKSTLREVIVRLGELGIGLVAVMAGGSVAGVISERDVVWALAEGADPDLVWAADVMTAEVVVVEPSTTVSDAARLMAQQDIRHLIVLSGDTPGVVSLRDMIEYLVD